MAAIEQHVEQEHEHGHASAATRLENLKFATWLYLASEVIIFTVLIATYVVFSLNNRDVVHEVHEKAGIVLVAINTFILLASSWAMVMGLRELKLGNRKGLITWIGRTALLGAVFVAFQYVEYRTLSDAGVVLFYTGGELSEFGMRFYAPTAFHGAHVIIGVLWALFIIWNARRGNYSETNYAGVEVFGLYWHFVDVVWIFLFTFIYLI
ncbi:MAG: heme-copper oxidase subunit III [Anaerolineae bacterium]|nr:heme-copper oxidase subunit III [Anaerolineae bacterium]